MNGRHLLDTNIVIACFAGEKIVLDRLAQAPEVFVPSIVLGELYYGARKSARVVENVSRVDEFARANTILPCDAVTAKAYAEIKNALRAKGRPIPENDLWIASIAKQHDLILISRDSHFGEITGLFLEAW